MPAKPATAREPSARRKPVQPATARERFSRRRARCASTCRAAAVAVPENFLPLVKRVAAEAACAAPKPSRGVFPPEAQPAGAFALPGKRTTGTKARPRADYIY